MSSISGLDDYITGHGGEDSFDEAWELVHELLDDLADANNLSADDVMGWLRHWASADNLRLPGE